VSSLTASTATLDLATLSLDSFARASGAALTLVHGDQSLVLTLAAVRAHPAAAGPDSQRIPFSLLLRADEAARHPILGLRELIGDLHGLDCGVVAGVMVVRVLRPVGLPAGAYYQVTFG
jgi:hypothetical protein